MSLHRDDQSLSREFAKNSNFENILSIMNQALSKEEEELITEKGNFFPTVHIIGAPRSGTTLATQLLVSYLDVGYINNLIAAFWKAPIFGIELSKKLLGERYKSNFKSRYGRTEGIQEPHEFGYFWNHHLKYGNLQQHSKNHENTIDWHQLKSILNNMTYFYEKPIIFKSFLFGFHAKRALDEIPSTCFIYIKRNFISNALSILKLRKKLNGDVHEWGSIKPRQYEQLKNLTVYEQIAGQILCLESEYLKQLESIPNENKAYFKYEDICANPMNFVRDTNSMIENHFDGNRFDEFPIPSLEASHFQGNSEQENMISLFIEAKNKIKSIFPDLVEWK